MARNAATKQIVTRWLEAYVDAREGGEKEWVSWGEVYDAVMGAKPPHGGRHPVDVLSFRGFARLWHGVATRRGLLKQTNKYGYVLVNV